MNITPDTIFEMNAKDKEIYFEHLEKRHKEEALLIEQERKSNAAYKQFLIEDILEITNRFSKDDLSKYSIRVLETIFDNC